MAYKTVLARDLKLADKIMLPSDPTLGVSVVKNVTDYEVTLFRPYPETADFSYSGGVICYVGIEEFSIPRNGVEYLLIGRKELK